MPIKAIQSSLGPSVDGIQGRAGTSPGGLLPARGDPPNTMTFGKADTSELSASTWIDS